MNQLVIRPIPMVKFAVPKSIMTYLTNLDQEANLTAGAWYIEGAKSHIMVDTGCEPSMLEPHGTCIEPIQSLGAGLGRLGLRPEDIDIVIVTHLHFDHIAFGSRYPNAKFIIQRKELDFGLNPHPYLVLRGSLIADYFTGLDFEVVDGDVDIVPGIRVLLTPGHSPGGQSIAVGTALGRAIIAGFCCVEENFYPSDEVRGQLPIIPPGFLHDTSQAYDSVLQVRAAADIVVPLHDPKYTMRDSIP